MGKEFVPETSENLHILTLLTAKENLIEVKKIFPLMKQESLIADLPLC